MTHVLSRATKNLAGFFSKEQKLINEFDKFKTDAQKLLNNILAEPKIENSPESLKKPANSSENFNLDRGVSNYMNELREMIESQKAKQPDLIQANLKEIQDIYDKYRKELWYRMDKKAYYRKYNKVDKLQDAVAEINTKGEYTGNYMYPKDMNKLDNEIRNYISKLEREVSKDNVYKKEEIKADLEEIKKEYNEYLDYLKTKENYIKEKGIRINIHEPYTV